MKQLVIAVDIIPFTLDWLCADSAEKIKNILTRSLYMQKKTLEAG